MIKTRGIALIACCFISACGEFAQIEDKTTVKELTYRCNNTSQLTVAYIDNNTIHVMHKKQVYQLSRTPSASGEKYQNQHYIWWTKGKKGIWIKKLKNNSRIEFKCKI